MIIDVTPKTVRPSHTTSLIMELRELDVLYCFEDHTGAQLSVMWTPETIKEFLPSRKVSYFIESLYRTFHYKKLPEDSIRFVIYTNE